MQPTGAKYSNTLGSKVFPIAKRLNWKTCSTAETVTMKKFLPTTTSLPSCTIPAFGTDVVQLYENLIDTEYLFNAIRSQKNCSKVDSIKNITEVLTKYQLDDVGGAGGDVQIVSQEETKEKVAETQHEEEILTELAKEPLLSTKSLSTYTPFPTLTFLLAGLLVSFFLLLFGRRGKRRTTIDVNGGFGGNMNGNGNGDVEMEPRGNGSMKQRKTIPITISRIV